MINFFNEKTVYCGTSIRDFNQVRNTLEKNKIPYKYKTTDLNHNRYMGGKSVNRSMGGNFNKVENSLLYEVVVNKRDYEEAIGRISREKN